MVNAFDFYKEKLPRWGNYSELEQRGRYDRRVGTGTLSLEESNQTTTVVVLTTAIKQGPAKWKIEQMGPL